MDHIQSASGQGRRVSLGCRYHADVQTKVRGSAGWQDSDQLWREVKMNAQSTTMSDHLWVEPDIRTTQSTHYDITLNNQYCFDFIAWSCAQSYILVGGVHILVFHSSQIIIS